MPETFPSASQFAESKYDPSIERRFFGRIVLANGTFKSTTARRMDDLNLAALPYIRALPERPVLIKDVAASSGISTQEWYEALSSADVQTQMVGTDVSTEAFHLPGKLVDILLDRERNVIHLSLFGQAVHPRILKTLRRLGIGVIARLRITMGARPIPFPLISKAVRNIEIVHDDFEAPLGRPERRFDVIRAANILNLGYFDKVRLTGIMSGLLHSLRPGGLFIVCRTLDDGSNHGTIFRYDESRLTILKRVGNGSEVEVILPEDAPPPSS